MGKKRLSKEIRQLRFEVSFYAQLIRKLPEYVDALVLLGDAYTRLGMYEKGLKVDLKLSRLCPKDSIVWYNLACSYSLLERVDEAFLAISKAIESGYYDFDYMDNDPDLANLKKDKRYQRVKKVKELKYKI